MNSLQVYNFKANDKGQDYIVGDMHGCYDEFMGLLEDVDFDKSIDRVFSVGDLCDRGEQSLECLELIFKPWFNSVLGNHEVMLMEYIDKLLSGDSTDECKSFYYSNGGEWVASEVRFDSIVSSRLFDIYNKLLEVPTVIVVGENETRFNIVHAELPSSINITNDKIDESFKNEKNLEKIISHAYWGRTLFKDYVNFSDGDEFFNGLSLTYCGHSIINRPFLLESHCFIDTGAFTDTGELTMVKALEPIKSY